MKLMHICFDALGRVQCCASLCRESSEIMRCHDWTRTISMIDLLILGQPFGSREIMP